MAAALSSEFSDLVQIKKQLISMISQCKERGLVHSVKWASELAFSLDPLPLSEIPAPPQVTEYNHSSPSGTYIYSCDRCNGILVLLPVKTFISTTAALLQFIDRPLRRAIHPCTISGFKMTPESRKVTPSRPCPAACGFMISGRDHHLMCIACMGVKHVQAALADEESYVHCRVMSLSSAPSVKEVHSSSQQKFSLWEDIMDSELLDPMSLLTSN
ncbi:cell division cycle protein 23 homolog [Tachysurus ichikawai]